jgi:endonuclease/exonuclease/phosphatase family metal-dependent hydrolase
MTITALTWNIRGISRPDLSDLAQIIESHNADIAVIQEIQHWQARRLAKALHMQWYWSFKHAPLGPLFRFLGEGLAILSKHPITDMQTTNLTPSIGHFSYKRRVAQYARIAHLDLGVTNIHLASHRDANARLEQAEMLLDQPEVAQSRRMLLAGDFNASDEPMLYARFALAGYVDVAEHAVNHGKTKPGSTSPAGNAHQRIDRVFASPDIHVLACTTPQDGPDWAKRSDHLPVIAVIE